MLSSKMTGASFGRVPALHAAMGASALVAEAGGQSGRIDGIGSSQTAEYQKA